MSALPVRDPWAPCVWLQSRRGAQGLWRRQDGPGQRGAASGLHTEKNTASLRDGHHGVNAPGRCGPEPDLPCHQRRAGHPCSPPGGHWGARSAQGTREGCFAIVGMERAGEDERCPRHGSGHAVTGGDGKGASWAVCSWDCLGLCVGAQRGFASVCLSGQLRTGLVAEGTAWHG